jgi:putative hydrolase
MNLTVDAHVHSINSIHAYSTIAESAAQAAAAGIECIAITDHFGPMFLGTSLFQAFVGIRNIKSLPEHILGVRILTGVEIDILAPDGALAFSDTYLSYNPVEPVTAQLLPACDVVIASYHSFLPPMTKEENTKMIQQALRHPQVNILGHCDRISGGIDVEAVVKTAKEHHKIIELNCQSLKGGEEACAALTELALSCKRNSVWIAVNSDAHNAYVVGQFAPMKELLHRIDFPQELIVTRSEEEFLRTLQHQRDLHSNK